MKFKLFTPILLVGFLGCSSVKEATGDYIAEAVKEKIEREVDAKLAEKNLTTKEIKHSLDLNNDGKITKEEVISSTKDMLKDAIILEANNYVEKKLNENAASKGELESKAHQFWMMILGLVSAYLTKQIWSAKQDGKRNERISVVEKLLGLANSGGQVDPKVVGLPAGGQIDPKVIEKLLGLANSGGQIDPNGAGQASSQRKS